jgi:hypothetical protein
VLSRHTVSVYIWPVRPVMYQILFSLKSLIVNLVVSSGTSFSEYPSSTVEERDVS